MEPTMFNTQKLLIQIMTFLSLLPLPATATETIGSLKTGSSALFANFNYSSFVFDSMPGARFQIVMKSKALDSYLMAVAPDGKILTNDDHQLSAIPKLSSGDAAIVVEHPMQGRWILVATTLDPGKEGDYRIDYIGISKLEAMLPSTAEDKKIILSAFSARSVEDPTRRRDALFDQLTLKSFRDELKQRLQAELSRLDKLSEELRAKVTSLDQRKQRLLDSANALQGIGQSREFLLDLVSIEQKKVESETEQTTERLLKSVRERIAFSQALAELERLNIVAEDLKGQEEELIRNDVPTRTSDLSQNIIRLRGEREAIGKSIADKLLDSRLVLDRRFGGFSFTNHYAGGASKDRAQTGALLGGARLFMLDHSFAIAGALASGPSRVPILEVEPRVWLPALLPWPPPIPSSHIVLDRHLLDRRKLGLATLGDLDSALQFALSRAGYSDASYWGVPRGFALVTPLEQTDSTGRPLAAHMRWLSKIAEMKAFSLAEYIKALFSAPTGYFRVLVFIASPSPFAPSGSREILQTIERWSAGGLNVLPDSLRTEPLTDQHRVTVLVYEFQKLKDSERPTNTVPGRLKVPDHFEATNLAFLLR